MDETYSDDNLKHLKKIVTDLLINEVEDINVITEELLMYIVCDSYNMKTLLNKTRALAIPSKFSNNNRLEYLDSMHRMISSNTLNIYFNTKIFPYINKNKISKELFTLMKNVKYYGENCFNDFIGNLGIVTLIIAYLYENKINDYTILNNFLNNPSYYYEKLTLSGITFYETELHEFYLFDYNKIYNNIENIFNNRKDKIFIK